MPALRGLRVADRPEVWQDLGVWSNQDMDGEFGTFTVRIYGAQEHIGIPRAQTLLAQEELDGLPGVFVMAGLDPTAEPSEQALVRALHDHGKNVLAAVIESGHDLEKAWPRHHGFSITMPPLTVGTA